MSIAPPQSTHLFARQFDGIGNQYVGRIKPENLMVADFCSKLMGRDIPTLVSTIMRLVLDWNTGLKYWTGLFDCYHSCTYDARGKSTAST